MKLDLELDTKQFMDTYCRSTVSDLDVNDARQKALFDLITGSMTHKCSCDCLKDGKCKRGYTSEAHIPENSVGSDGFPQYKRPQDADLRIVPTHEAMILDWDGHINHEACGSTFTVLYLYKYLFKGNKKTNIEFEEIDEFDEIKRFQYGSLLCSSDAAWRMFGFQNYPRSDPSTVVIKTKTPDEIAALLFKSQLCDLYLYFNRLNSVSPLTTEMRNEIANMTFVDFFQKWSDVSKQPSADTTFTYEINIPEETIRKKIFFKQRVNNGDNVVVRMGNIPITSGEKWYLRLLLKNKPCTSFNDLLSLNTQSFTTFQDSAVAHGYVSDRLAAFICFREVQAISLPDELRSLFTMLSLNGYPTLCILQDPECKKKMMDDFLIQRDNNVDLATRDLMLDLSRRVKASNRTLSDFGIEEPPESLTEMEFIQMRYEVNAQKLLYETLITENPLTAEMKELFDAIIASIQSGTYGMFVLQGKAGSGKSTFVKALMAYVRSQGKIAVGCASTGLAATVYESFHTAHALFGIPVIDDEDADKEEIKLQPSTERREVVDASSLIVWDENFSNHSECQEVVVKEFMSPHKDIPPKSEASIPKVTKYG